MMATSASPPGSTGDKALWNGPLLGATIWPAFAPASPPVLLERVTLGQEALCSRSPHSGAANGRCLSSAQPAAGQGVLPSQKENREHISTSLPSPSFPSAERLLPFLWLHGLYLFLLLEVPFAYCPLPFPWYSQFSFVTDAHADFSGSPCPLSQAELAATPLLRRLSPLTLLTCTT